MSTSAEKKLRQLLDKKNELEDQIKEIQQAKNRELRKLHEKRCQILGKAIYDSLKKGKSIHLDSLDEITGFLDPLLKRKSDRDLFDLSVSERQKSIASNQETKADKKSTVKESESEAQSETLTEKKTPRKSTRKTSTKPKTTTAQSKPPLEESEQEEMMKDFNL